MSAGTIALPPAIEARSFTLAKALAALDGKEVGP
jgi:hypothetical protein